MDLRRYLFENNLTQTEFARMIGYHRAYVSQVCKKRVPVGKGIALAIEKATNAAVTIEELMEDREKHYDTN